MDLTSILPSLINFVLHNPTPIVCESPEFQVVVKHQHHLLLHGSVFYDSTVEDDYYTFESLPEMCNEMIRMCKKSIHQITYLRFAEKVENCLEYMDVQRMMEGM